MNDCCSEQALTVPVTQGIPERALPGSPLQITLAGSRKWCATCTRRKTYWVVEYGPFCKHTVCWECMGPRVRAAFRAGY